LDKDQARAKARQFATRAIQLDETLPEAHLALANLLLADDYPAAEVEIKRALSLNPSHADAHEWYARILRGKGEMESALEELKKAYELDPLPANRRWFLVTQYYFVGRNEEALAICDRLIQTDQTGHFGRAVLMAIKGNREEAYKALETYRRFANEMVYKSVVARIEGHLGNREEASRLIDETLVLINRGDLTEPNVARWQLSYTCALIRDPQRFYPLVEYLVERKIYQPGELGDPAFNNMRGEARFAELLKKLRVSYGIAN